MTKAEWISFIQRLNLSCRSTNLLIRAFREPSLYEDKQAVVWASLSEVETYNELKYALEGCWKSIRSFGWNSFNETISAIENLLVKAPVEVEQRSKAMTNFERIKQMTASEFAGWIDAVADACYNKGYHYRNCEGCPLKNVGKCTPDDIAKWLEEAEEQNDDEL